MFFTIKYFEFYRFFQEFQTFFQLSSVPYFFIQLLNGFTLAFRWKIVMVFMKNLFS